MRQEANGEPAPLVATVDAPTVIHMDRNILLLWVRICLDTECLGIALHCLQKEGKVTLLVSVYSVFRKRTSGLFPPTVIGQAIAGY